VTHDGHFYEDPVYISSQSDEENDIQMHATNRLTLLFISSAQGNYFLQCRIHNVE